MGLGASPSSKILFLSLCLRGLATGAAERRAWVYGWAGSEKSVST